MTQGAERLPRLGLCRAVLRSGRPRTARGGVRDPFLRLLLLAQVGRLRMVGSGTCQHPPAGRLARQAPLRAEGGPENQGGEGPRPGHRPSPRRPMQARLSRETGEDAQETQIEARRPRRRYAERGRGRGFRPQGGGPGLGDAMTEKRGARSMRSRAWEGIKEEANYNWR
jgi:hypothetical protein